VCRSDDIFEACLTGRDELAAGLFCAAELSDESFAAALVPPRYVAVVLNAGWSPTLVGGSNASSSIIKLQTAVKQILNPTLSKLARKDSVVSRSNADRAWEDDSATEER
jgi:hypothetical protein